MSHSFARSPLMIDIEGVELTADDVELLQHPLVGGVILFSRNYQHRAQVSALIKSIHALKTPALIVAIDQEGGSVQRMREDYVELPPMARVGELFQDQPYVARQRAEDLGWLCAAELRDVGIDLNFAPVVDLDYAVSEVIGNRSFGRDPNQVAELAGAFLGGLHSGGVASCLKHFPGHGAVVTDSHHGLPCDRRTRQELDADLWPFRQLVGRTSCVMTAHLVAECEDTDIVSYSSRWVTGVLREELGFSGIVCSDDLSMKGADTDGGGIQEKVVRAVAAGCDLLPICNDRASVEQLLSLPPELPPTRSLAPLRGNGEASNSYSKTIRYDNIIKWIDDIK